MSRRKATEIIVIGPQHRRIEALILCRFPAVLADADVVVLGVPHVVYEEVESAISDRAPADAGVDDICGFLDPDALDQAYDCFGINDPDAE